MQEPESYTYSAFVSYRHLEEDRRWAEWLVDALERYRTPDPVIAAGYPAQLGTIFRDDDELRASPDLTAEIRAALWASKYLLVVCTPDTPRSDWVRAEISLFQHWARADRIIPILVEGNPASSFPPELRRTEVIGEGPNARFTTVEPRGADVSPKQGKSEAEQREHALLTIAASVLGCTFDTLRDRHAERERRETSSAWFHDIAWRRSGPVGVVPLTAEMVGRREYSYRFDTIAGRVVRVRRENSRGVLREENGVAQWDVSYREDGSVELVEERTRLGVVRLRRRCNRDATKIDLAHEDDSAAPMAGNATGFGLGQTQSEELAARKTTIVRHLVDYDARGFAVRRRFCRDSFDTPEADSLGHYGEGNERDDQGRVTVAWALDQAGRPMIQRNGVARITFEYAPEGWQSGSTLLDEDGQPTLGQEGFAKVVQRHDSAGNFLEWTCFDAHGQITLDGDGVAQNVYIYDERGDWIERACFGTEGEPVLYRGGYARLTMKYNDEGHRIGESTWGLAGEPVLNKNGVARFSNEFDARGNWVRVCCFGVAGEPVFNSEGYASIAAVHDDRGNVIDLRFFGLDGAPILQKDGLARVTMQYDERGNKLQEAFLGLNDEPVLHRNGYARFTNLWDARGNPIEQRYFGTDGQPILLPNGYSAMRQVFDANGHVCELSYFGEDGEAVCIRDGYAIVRYTYDALGNLVGTAHFDAQDQPALHRDGYSRMTFAYDRRGNQIATACFGTGGEPVLHKNGFASAQIANDLRGKPIELIYLGLDGQPVLNHQGIARFTARYDAQGNLIEQQFFGISGEPVRKDGGFARFTTSYDVRGHMTEMVFYDVDGSPALHRDGYARFSAIRDARGNDVEGFSFGADGRLVLTKGGMAHVTRRFDARNRLIEERCFGLSDEAVLRANDSCDDDEDLKGLFGEWRGLMLAALYTQDQRAAISAGGFAAFEQAFDKRGDLVSRRFSGLDGEPVNGPEGFAQIQVDYAFMEKPAAIRGFAADGTALPELHIAYTPLRDVAGVCFRLPGGDPWTSHQGFAEMRLIRNARHDHVETQYFDAAGRMVASHPVGG